MPSGTTPTATASDAAALAVLEELALAAGAAIIRIRDAGLTVEAKADASPVTEADRTAERIILAGLRARFPDIPCVAEEEASAGLVPERLGRAFFLVDPLDGTKEFVRGNPDFTVNIALVRDGMPALGVVYAPARKALYSACPGQATAACVSADRRIGKRHPIAVRRRGAPLAILASRSHRTAETDAWLARFPDAEIVAVGSSLKFCMLAAGEADLYPRFGRTMEWDTAAGDAILRAAGGATRTLDGKPLAYGKRNLADDADFANPSFIAEGWRYGDGIR